MDNDENNITVGHSDDCTTIDISSGIITDFSIDTVTLNGILGPSYSGNVTIGTGSAGSSLYSTGGLNGTSWNSTSYGTISSAPNGLSVTGDSEFDGDIKIKGVSISKALTDIQKRLAILVPDPAKLEHFEALRKAYDHYKTLEALCEITTKDD